MNALAINAMPKDKLSPLLEALETAHGTESAFSISSIGELHTEDCTMQELIPHIVLVHALGSQTFFHFPNLDPNLFEDKEYQRISSIKAGMTPEGLLGHHLETYGKEFQNKVFLDRPHLHWSWNQLVQSNSGGSWEDAPCAILEPFATFEEGLYYKPLAVAPYDTMTSHSHRCSAHSTILVPRVHLAAAKAYFSGFQGRIMPFDENIRKAIIIALQEHYPKTWHICDKEGELVGNKVQYSDAGYNSETYLRKTNGTIIQLMKGGGADSRGRTSQAMQEFHADGRYIGLHTNFFTSWLENKAAFKALKLFKESNEKTKVAKTTYLYEKKENGKVIEQHYVEFAGTLGRIERLPNLCSLEALKFYQKAWAHNPKTGVQQGAAEILNEAIYADLVSVFSQTSPNSSFPFSLLELKIIFSTHQHSFRTLLDDIQTYLDKKTFESRQKAMEIFNSYHSLLQEALSTMRLARDETARLIDQERAYLVVFPSDIEEYPLPLLIAEEEWQAIELPSSIDFDLGESWPHTQPIIDYVNKMVRTLPAEVAQLQALHQQLLSYVILEPMTLEEQKKQYRLNIVQSTIRWSLQEKNYLLEQQKNIFISECSSSILASKLSQQLEWLGKYGLKAEDFTRQSGNCLFDNIAIQLPSGEATPEDLRRDMVRFMGLHREEYDTKFDYQNHYLPFGDGEKSVSFETWEDYLSCLSHSRVWVTELEVQALAFQLRCPIVLLATNKKPKIYNSEGEKTPLFLHHFNNNHFEACVPFKGLNPTEIYQVIQNQDHY
jgi:hypothetical protein